MVPHKSHRPDVAAAVFGARASPQAVQLVPATATQLRPGAEIFRQKCADRRPARARAWRESTRAPSRATARPPHPVHRAEHAGRRSETLSAAEAQTVSARTSTTRVLFAGRPGAPASCPSRTRPPHEPAIRDRRGGSAAPVRRIDPAPATTGRGLNHVLRRCARGRLTRPNQVREIDAEVDSYFSPDSNAQLLIGAPDFFDAVARLRVRRRDGRLRIYRTHAEHCACGQCRSSTRLRQSTSSTSLCPPRRLRPPRDRALDGAGAVIRSARLRAAGEARRSAPRRSRCVETAPRLERRSRRATFDRDGQADVRHRHAVSSRRQQGQGFERGLTVSKSWDEATTRGAFEVANHVKRLVDRFAGTRAGDPERAYSRPSPGKVRSRFAGRLQWTKRDASSPTCSASRPIRAPPCGAWCCWPSSRRVPSHRAAWRQTSDAARAWRRVRLALGLWDSLPDEPLAQAAAVGGSARGQVAAEARMLGDLRFTPTSEFFHHWLQMRYLE